MSKYRKRDFLIFAILSLTPVTGIISFGHLIRTLNNQSPQWIWPLNQIWNNFRLGTKTIFATTLFLLPSLFLMHFGWTMGWQNSFLKGYELFHIGPLTSWAGIFLFMITLIFLPICQIHQISKQNILSIFDLSIAIQVLKKKPLNYFWLNLLLILFALPIFLQRVLLMFLGAANAPQWALAFLLILTAIITSVGFVYTRKSLHRSYKETLQMPPVSSANWIVFAMAGIIFLIWFTYIFALYVTQFFNYIPIHGFFIQPILQWPWFNSLN